MMEHDNKMMGDVPQPNSEGALKDNRGQQQDNQDVDSEEDKKTGTTKMK